MADITVADVTNSNGTGTFDNLVSAVQTILTKEFKENRITGTEYSKIFMSSLDSAMNQSMQFILQKDQSAKQVEVLEAQRQLTLVQKQIAEKLGISISYYSQWEVGKRTPASNNLQKLADIYDVSTDYLLGNTDIKSKTLETDLNKTLDTVRSFDGKPITDADRETIREILKRRQLEREQKADN